MIVNTNLFFSSNMKQTTSDEFAKKERVHSVWDSWTVLLIVDAGWSVVAWSAVVTTVRIGTAAQMSAGRHTVAQHVAVSEAVQMTAVFRIVDVIFEKQFSHLKKCYSG